MSINKIALVASAIMLCPIGSVAQNNDTQMVKVEAGVKTYYPSKMGFSQNEPISNVIKMITKYKERITIYTLMVNGENYLQDPESFYAHTLVADVERIEVITDPSISGNTIGLDGNINIVLRNKEEGTHGRVGFQIETNNSHIPTFNISHKADKWTVWGNYVGNISHSKSDKEEYLDIRATSDLKASREKFYFYNENDKKKLNALNFGANYKDEKNSITLEIINRNAPTTSNIEKTSSKMTTDMGVKEFTAIIDWKHTLNAKTSFGVNLSHEREKDNADIADTEYNNLNFNSFERNICVKSNTTRFDIHADYRPFDILGIKAGVKGAWMNSKREENEYENLTYDNDTYESDSSRFTPYILVQLKVGQFKFSAGERYDFNEETLKYKTGDCSGNKSFNSSLTTVSAEWKPNAQNRVMASYRYHAIDMCRFTIYADLLDRRVEPWVEDIDCNIYNLNYAYTGENISAGLKMQYTKGIDVYPYAYYNTSYEMTTTNDVDLYDITASIAYHQDVFAVMGDINFYKADGEEKTTGGSYYSSENYEYTTGNTWIFRITPMLSLPKNINVSASAMFVSHRVDNSYHYLRSVNDKRQFDKWLTLRASKSWKNFDLYVKWENAFDKRETYDKRRSVHNFATYGCASENKFENRLTFGGSFRF